jgi:hypothetical protein
LWGEINLLAEHRQIKRVGHKSIVTLEIGQKGHFIYGQTKNMSANGLCLESDYEIKSGTIVDITIDKLPYKSDRKKYRALVKWCEAVANSEAMYSYEVGVNFL